MDEKKPRIDKEIKRLKRLLKDVPKHKLQTVDSLISNAAFMSVALEDLQEAINRNGYVTEYQHGAGQSGMKKTPEVEIYNQMIKNQMTIMKQVVDLLPQSDGVKKKDVLLELMKK